MKLTAKQELFITEYMKDLNATQAAIRAGYSEKTAYSIGEENLKKPELKKEIDKRLEERAKSNGITAEYVLQGIKSIADDYEAKHNDKLKAFELLGKHLKLFTDKLETDNNNRNYNFNKDISKMSDEEILQELELMGNE